MYYTHTHTNKNYVTLCKCLHIALIQLIVMSTHYRKIYKKKILKKYHYYQINTCSTWRIEPNPVPPTPNTQYRIYPTHSIVCDILKKYTKTLSLYSRQYILYTAICVYVCVFVLYTTMYICMCLCFLFVWVRSVNVSYVSPIYSTYTPISTPLSLSVSLFVIDYRLID